MRSETATLDRVRAASDMALLAHPADAGGTSPPADARGEAYSYFITSVKPLLAVAIRSASSAATTAQPDGTAYQPVEWAKVILAAKVHGDASVSSPTVRLYPPGTTLQVLSRQNGWAQITDPTSGDRGWVYEQYLSPADGPTATQTAMADTASRVAAEPVGANRPTAKKRVRASRPAARMSGEYAFARFDRRWERRADRRGGIGLFFFGRFARAE